MSVFHFALCLTVAAPSPVTDALKAETALVRAAQKGDDAEIRELLKSGVSVNSTDGLVSALHAAVGYDQLHTVKLLISMGANVDSLSDEGATPLFEAAANGNLEMIRLLLDSGAKPNARSAFGDTALFRAIGYDKIDAAKLLLSRGADPNIRSQDGTPLMVAKKLKRKEIIEVLKAAGAQ